MKVRILVSIASAERGWAPGEVCELDDELAVKWIASGLAEPVAAGPDEAAIVTPPHAAVLKRPRGR